MSISSQKPKTSLCRAVGHQWQESSGGTFRICRHEYCTAQEQRNEAGEWVEAPTVRQRAARLRRKGQRFTQLPLWSHRPGVTDPDLWMDPAEERRAEQQYDRLIGRDPGGRVRR